MVEEGGRWEGEEMTVEEDVGKIVEVDDENDEENDDGISEEEEGVGEKEDWNCCGKETGREDEAVEDEIDKEAAEYDEDATLLIDEDEAGRGDGAPIVVEWAVVVGISIRPPLSAFFANSSRPLSSAPLFP